MLVDRYKAGHADRKTILSLITGGCWRRNFRSSTSTLHTTCFNLMEFVQPTTVIQLTNSNDDDGFMDRQLYSCPPEVHYDYDEYRQVPADIPKLSQIFAEIDEVHPSGCIYTLSQEAHTEFIAIHDSINERIRQQHQHEHDRKSILSKGHGQLLCLAAIYTCNYLICTQVGFHCFHVTGLCVTSGVSIHVIETCTSLSSHHSTLNKSEKLSCLIDWTCASKNTIHPKT